MSYSHKVIRTYRNGNDGTIVQETQTVTGGIEINVNEAVGEATTTVLVIGLDMSALKSFVMHCDVACSIGINDAASGAPDGEWALAANQPLVWTSIDPENDGTAQACPITADVTEIHVTVAGAVAGTFSLSALLDPTP